MRFCLTYFKFFYLLFRLMPVVLAGHAPGLVKGQTSYTIEFEANWQDRQLLADSQYTAKETGWIRFGAIRYYVHGVALVTTTGMEIRDQRKHRLIDFSDPASTRFQIYAPEQQELSFLHFKLGVDSLTQSGGAIGEDLDPVNGMYWTWQSGYISIKLEGASLASPHQKHEFALHLGGYREPFQTIKSVSLPISTKGNSVKVGLDLFHFMQHCPIQETHHIMSPSNVATQLATVFASSFQIIQP